MRAQNERWKESISLEKKNLVPAKKADRYLNQCCGYPFVCQKRKQISMEWQKGHKQEVTPTFQLRQLPKFLHALPRSDCLNLKKNLYQEGGKEALLVLGTFSYILKMFH